VDAGVAVLLNPQAGSGNTELAALSSQVGGGGFAAHVGTPAELWEFARRAQREAVAIVAVCGGDGTLGRVATALAQCYGEGELPALAPLGGGTMNTIARSLGMRRPRPEATLRSLLAGDASRTSQSTMRIDGAEGRTRIGFMMGAGVPARFLWRYEQGARLGAWRAARVLGELIGSALIGGRAARELFVTVDGKASVDGRDLGLTRLSIVYAAVIDDIGLGFRPTPRARERLGTFQVLVGDARAMDLARALPRLRSDRGIGGEPWIDVCGSSLDVAFGEPTVYMVDGDVEAPVRQLDVRAGPIIQMLVAGRRVSRRPL
jgi:diacylglycerol kinase family enzyme